LGMKQLTYKADISAPAKIVWDTMLGPETYKVWTAVAWPDSHYIGEMGPNNEIRFVDSGGAGTRAGITKYQPHELVVFEHMVILLPGGAEDRESDMAKTWIGSIEQYAFSENAGVTEVVVTMTINPKWEAMFNNDWPKALAKLKEICEG
jgi:hypothetical protein